MSRFVLAPAAERDIEEILARSHERFGEQARQRYEALLVRAILDVSSEPKRAGSYHRPEIAESVLTYHLRHSRERVDSSVGRVSHARHFLLYRVNPDGQVEIGRVLHESMDLDRHLPEDYRPSSSS